MSITTICKFEGGAAMVTGGQGNWTNHGGASTMSVVNFGNGQYTQTLNMSLLVDSGAVPSSNTVWTLDASLFGQGNWWNSYQGNTVAVLGTLTPTGGAGGSKPIVQAYLQTMGGTLMNLSVGSGAAPNTSYQLNVSITVCG